MKLIQDIYGTWHNTAKIGTISVQPKRSASYGVVIEEIGSDGVGHTIEVSMLEGEAARRDAEAILDSIAVWLCYGEELRRSSTYPLLENERREKADREAALRRAQSPV